MANAADLDQVAIPVAVPEVRSITVPDIGTRHIASADPIMAELIRQIGPLEYRVDGDIWRAIIGSIVGQQLSVAAAATIRARIAKLGGAVFPAPESIVALSDDVLRACGLSRAKAAYVRDAARCWLAGEIASAALAEMGDDQVIQTLVRIRGVGRWTAEMVLLFSLGRPDVLAADDLGIRSAVQRAYQLPERPGKAELERIAAPWSPFRSYASLYLWRSLKPSG